MVFSRNPGEDQQHDREEFPIMHEHVRLSDVNEGGGDYPPPAHRHSRIADVPTGTSVSIEIPELISLLASQITHKIIDELREKDIIPLVSRITELELTMAKPSPTAKIVFRWQSALNALWQVGVALYAIIHIAEFLSRHGIKIIP